MPETEKMKPGLYFVQSADGAIYLQEKQDESPPCWYSMCSEIADNEPAGTILSGPHTPAELYGYLRTIVLAADRIVRMREWNEPTEKSKTNA